jgi:hypothetical protein
MIFKQLHAVNRFEPSKTLHHPKEGNIAFILVLLVIEKKKNRFPATMLSLKSSPNVPQQPKLSTYGVCVQIFSK